MCSTVQTERLIVQVGLARSLTDFGRYLAGTFIAWDPGSTDSPRPLLLVHGYAEWLGSPTLERGRKH